MTWSVEEEGIGELKVDGFRNAHFTALRPGTCSVIVSKGDIFAESFVTVTGDINAPIITTRTLPDALVDLPYDAVIEILDADSYDTHTFELTDGPGWLSIDVDTGVLSGTPTIQDVAADITVAVRVTDSGDLSDEASYTIDVLTSNNAPVILTTSLPSAEAYAEYSETIEVEDLDVDDTHTFELTEGPAWLSIDEPGNLSGIPEYDDIGEDIPITIVVTDSGTPSLSDTLSTTLVVTAEPNEAPLIATEELPDAVEDTLYSVTIEITDPNTIDAHTFELTDGPEWLSIDPETGELSGTPENEDVAEDITISVKVTDIGDLFAEASYTITVVNTNDAPEILTTSLPDARVNEEYSAGLEVEDPDVDDAHSFALTEGPAWLSIDEFGFLSGTPGYADAGEDITITIEVTDTGTPSLSDTLSTTIVVTAEPNEVPLITTEILPNAAEDTLYNATIEITDPNAIDTHTFELTDGPEWLSIDPETGVLSGTPENEDVAAGITIEVKVTDNGGLFAEASFTITVVNTNNAPEILSTWLPDALVNNDYSLSIQVEDPDIGDSYTYELTEGPEWLSIHAETGNLAGTPGIDDEGDEIPVRIKVTDTGGLFHEVAFTINVLPVVVESLVISPADAVVIIEDYVQYSVRAYDGEGRLVNVQVLWSTSGDVGEIDVNGKFTATYVGDGTVTATFESISAEVAVYVSDVTTHTMVVRNNHSFTLISFPFPMDFLNGMTVYFPEGSFSDDITITFKVPSFAQADYRNKDVTFYSNILGGVSIDVSVNGEVVSPYYFDAPVEITLPYNDRILQQMGISPLVLGMFFFNSSGELDAEGISNVYVDADNHYVSGSVSHLSQIAIAPTSVTPGVEEDTMPAGYSLSQNYPNPFNLETTITYGIPETSHVRIVIYNILGERLRILENETKFAGNYSVIWDGTNSAGQVVTSGVYIYCIETEKFFQSKKLMLIK